MTDLKLGGMRYHHSAALKFIAFERFGKKKVLENISNILKSKLNYYFYLKNNINSNTLITFIRQFSIIIWYHDIKTTTKRLFLE